MKIILLLILLTPLFLFAQEDIDLNEGSDTEICGRIVRIEGIYIYDGRIKADLSVLIQRNSKPVSGGYKMGDTIEIKDGCRYLIKEIEKYGLNNSHGYVTLTENLEPTEYLVMGLTQVSRNEKFNIGNKEWTPTRISKDDVDFEIKEDGKGKPTTVTLKKNDVIWRGFTLYRISDLVNTSTDIFYETWVVKFEKVKDYSYLSLNTPSIDGALINPPPMYIDSPSQLIIRKMKYYPKQKFVQEEYDATPVKYWVLKVFFYHTGMAHQMIEVNFVGQKSMQEFEGYKSFDTEAEAMEFAEVNGVSDIILEEK